MVTLYYKLRASIKIESFLLFIFSMVLGFFLIGPTVSSALNIKIPILSDLKALIDVNRVDFTKSLLIAFGYFLISFAIGVILGDWQGSLTDPELRPFLIVSILLIVFGLNYYGKFLPLFLPFPIFNGLFSAIDFIAIGIGYIIGVYVGSR